MCHFINNRALIIQADCSVFSVIQSCATHMTNPVTSELDLY